MAWLTETVPTMATIPAEEFAAKKQAIAADLLQVDTDINERMGTLAYEAVRLNGDLDRDAKVAATLESVTQEDLVNAFQNALAEETRATLTLYYDADGKEKTTPVEPLITDLDAFRASLPVVF